MCYFRKIHFTAYSVHSCVLKFQVQPFLWQFKIIGPTKPITSIEQTKETIDSDNIKLERNMKRQVLVKDVRNTLLRFYISCACRVLMEL